MEQRIVFDLDGTLIRGSELSGLQQRPGTTDLLSRLIEERNTPILWTSAGSEYVAKALTHAGLGGFFSEIYSSNNLPAVDVDNLTPLQRRLWWKYGERGVKIPPLVNSTILVDDNARMSLIIELAKAFNFSLVDPSSLENEPETEWANRVYQVLAQASLGLL